MEKELETKKACLQERLTALAHALSKDLFEEITLELDYHRRTIEKMHEALEKIKELSYPDNVCNNCVNCEELASEDWCKLTGKELEDASSQSCDKFVPHIVPQIYVIAVEALKGNTNEHMD